MKYLRNLLTLLLLAYLSTASVVTARDLGDSDRKALFESSAQANHDTIPVHLINWPLYFGVQQTGEIDASFDCFGNFGRAFGLGPYDFIYAPHFPSYVTPPTTGIEHLFGGAIWIGGIVGDDTLVSIGADGWQFISEFFPPEYPNSGSITPVEDYPADFSMRAEFTDTLDGRGNYGGLDPYGHRPLNIKVSNRSHAWHSFPENGTIIYDMVITNIGDKTIKEGYVGLYFDCDVGNDPLGSYWDDFAGSLRDQGIGYAIDNDGDFFSKNSDPATKIFASKFLETSFKADDTNFNWWIPNGNAAFDYGPRQKGTTENPFRDFGTGGTGTPEGDANKYYMMSFKEWDYDLIYSTTIGDSSEIWQPQEFPIADLSGSFDIRFLMSIGPFQLKPDSSIRISFATFTGDSVHNLPENFQDNLPNDPDLYLSNLNFNDVLANSALSDSLGQLLLDPNLPPLGFQIVKKNTQQPEFQWDPWAFDDILGYDLFIEEADLSQLPKPGAIPPWWKPSISDPSITLGPTHRLNIEDLDPNTIYLAQVAHVLSSGRGEPSTPISFKVNPRTAAPQTYSNYALAPPGQPITLKWNSPDKSSIDHYNIYKFADSSGAAGAYHASYDQGYQAQLIPASDSFLVEGKTYYYYAMEPFAVMPASDSEFIDPVVVDGAAYVITAANEFDFESEFTDPIVSYVVPEMDRNILLLTRGFNLTIINHTYIDSILSYYNSLLTGEDYEIYKLRDSLPSRCTSIECVDWRPLMRFKLLIIDDYLNEWTMQSSSRRLDALSRYIAYGGKILYFGKFGRLFTGMAIIDGQPQYDSDPIDFFGHIFGIKQMFTSGPGYYRNNGLPLVDSLFGFTRAQQISGFLPSLDLDTSRDPFNSRLRDIWPMATPPGVATFIPEEGVTSTHQFQSIHPITSIQQDHIVGLRKDWPEFNTQTYTFGFHLWYMDIADARELLEAVLSSSSLLASKTTISKDQYHVLESRSLEQSFANLYMGNIQEGIDVITINTSTIMINDSISPSSVEILGSFPNFVGKVLRLEIPLREFFKVYTPVWDTITAVYSITANLVDDRPVKTLGSFTLIGRLRRDINQDGQVNIADLTYLVDFLFRKGELPEPMELADVNSDGSVNILDLTGLVDYIFRGIPL